VPVLSLPRSRHELPTPVPFCGAVTARTSRSVLRPLPHRVDVLGHGDAQWDSALDGLDDGRCAQVIACVERVIQGVDDSLFDFAAGEPVAELTQFLNIQRIRTNANLSWILFRSCSVVSPSGTSTSTTA